MIGYIVLLTALSISAVAIYYSVAGLVAIFAAAAIPIMIMGGALEIGKLVTAVWLHRYWSRAAWWLRTYLAIAVLVLMMITSMGIFGFLSKAHIEQTSASQESVAQVQRLETEIARQTDLQKRAEDRIRQLETGNTGANATVQGQIDREQQRIDSAYSRVQPQIDAQNAIITQQTKLYSDQIAKIDSDLATLQGYINAGGTDNIKKAQGMVGAAADGAYGSRTAAKFKEWQDARAAERAELVKKIESAGTSNTTVRAAQAEITRIRRSVEAEIAESNKVINRLRSQVGQTVDKKAVETEITDQQAKLKAAVDEIDKLSQEKYKLQAEYRKLEAEVGPVKYIAEFIYGEQADKNMLEEAVRWVIIVIIFVFDPLAVLLLIASQYTFIWTKNDKDSEEKSEEFDFDEYEKVRAAKIDENPGWPWPVDKVKEKDKDELVQQSTKETSNAIGDPANHQSGSNDSEEDEKAKTIDPTPAESGTGDNGGDNVEGSGEVNLKSKKKEDLKSLEETKSKAWTPTRNAMFYPEEAEAVKEEKIREQSYLEKELDSKFQTAKAAWKESNPEQTLKMWKNLYIKGKIDKLPWEEGYTQNAEQSENTLFNKLQNKRANDS